MAAGVPNVIGSLWCVPDKPTAVLMTQFYRQLQLTGNPARALRSAMLEAMRENPNPKNWAAFTLIGTAQ
jgi:CHAT domain-containing protein